MMTASENPKKAIQQSMIHPCRSVHHRSFLWALCQELIRSTTSKTLRQERQETSRDRENGK
jgi:hypothetical protein